MKNLILLFLLTCNLVGNDNNIKINTSFINFTNNEKKYIESNTVKLGILSDHYPFSLQEDNNIIGFSYDYLNLIIKKSGLKVKFVTGDWSTLFNDFKNKKIDLIDSISYSKERESYTNFSKPYFEIANIMFVRKNDIQDFKGLYFLKDKKIGITKDVFYYDTLKSLGLFEIIEFQNTNEIIKALAYGKIDVAINNLIAGQKYIKRGGYSNIEVLDEIDDEIIKKEDLRIGITKENKVLFSIINKSMASITRLEKEELQQKWFVSKRVDTTTNRDIILSNKEKEYLKNKKQINMCIDPNWMPYEKFDKNAKHVGMIADYYKVFEQILDIDIKPIYTKTWNESLENAKIRKCDILSLSMETTKRTEYMNFTSPYLKLPLVIATQTDVPFISNIESIKEKSIGILKGYSSIEILKNKYKDLNIIEVNSIQDGLKKVNNGELFAYIGTLASVSRQFQEGLYGELKISGKLDEIWELGIGVRNDDEILLNILDKVVQSIKEEEHQKILNSWISIKYEKDTDYTLIWQIIFIVFIIALYRQYSLKKAIKSLDQILNSTIEAIAIFKADRLQNANQVFLDMYGYDSIKEVKGKGISSFILNEQKNKKIKVNTDSKPYELDMIRKDSIVFPALVRDVQVSKELRVTSVLDLSELKKKDKIFLEQSKLASMGEMIGNITHQWRQPLSVISTCATGMKIQKEYGLLEDHVFNKTCDDIDKNVQYLSNTIENFRNFINDERTKKVFILEDTINSCLNLVNGTSIASNIPVILNLQKDIKFDGYENELIQCLINIFNNSKDALLDTEIIQKFIFISTFEESENIIIKIKDNAKGIEENVLPKIFEPYFTTKHQSQGTGLGLHIAYNLIVEGMNGSIEVNNVSYKYKSEEYKGAEFIITIPK